MRIFTCVKSIEHTNSQEIKKAIFTLYDFDRMEEFDVIVVGGGPSGSVCATFLENKGKKVLLVDRVCFPRDKICGDGISENSFSILKELRLEKKLLKVKHKKNYGIVLSAPDGKIATFYPLQQGKASGIVCRREVFDNILFQHAKNVCTKTIEKFVIDDLVVEGGYVTGVDGVADGKRVNVKAKVIVGADGAHSIVAKKVGAKNNDEEHLAVACRTYYRNVTNLKDLMEVHFIEDSIPGYFWIFPLPDGNANVGIGMSVKYMKKKNMNICDLLSKITKKTPFKERFANAKMISPPRAWLLPFGSKKMKVCGNGYVLVGDAASLIDPFSGEGIHNALISGKLAARTICKALELNDFSEKILYEYHDSLYKNLGSGFTLGYLIQKIGRSRFAINLAIDQASKHKNFQEIFLDMLINPQNRKNIFKRLW